MNLGIICNIINNNPECIIVHNFNTSEIGYSTYNNEMSDILTQIFNNEIYSKYILNDKMHFKLCDKYSPYYINTLNDYIPYPYKIVWIKKIDGDIETILEESYQILKMEEQE